MNFLQLSDFLSFLGIILSTLIGLTAWRHVHMGQKRIDTATDFMGAIHHIKLIMEKYLKYNRQDSIQELEKKLGLINGWEPRIIAYLDLNDYKKRLEKINILYDDFIKTIIEDNKEKNESFIERLNELDEVIIYFGEQISLKFNLKKIFYIFIILIPSIPLVIVVYNYFLVLFGLVNKFYLEMLPPIVN